jgi:hypothetical protein
MSPKFEFSLLGHVPFIFMGCFGIRKHRTQVKHNKQGLVVLGHVAMKPFAFLASFNEVKYRESLYRSLPPTC